MAAGFEVFGLPNIPDVQAGDDLIELFDPALSVTPLTDGDIVIVTSKIVSKAEGRVRAGLARDEAIDAEAVRTVSEWTTSDGRSRIVQTRHGFVMAAAGVDASNVAPGSVALLPVDPDASARRLRDGLAKRYGVRVGVVITDTAGRAWRNGVVDIAIGVAGVVVLDDLRGQTDPYGNRLDVTVVAVADELAAASELVRSKLSNVPVAVARGLPDLVLTPGEDDVAGAALIRPSAHDRFRLGTPEAIRHAVLARRTTAQFAPDPIEVGIIRQAISAALTAPAPGGQAAWGFVLVESGPARSALVEAINHDLEADSHLGGLLQSAPRIVIPCLRGDGASRGDDHAAVLGLGAAVENMLVALGAEGIAATWLFPDAALTRAAARLDLPASWIPMGVLAIGRPVESAHEHPVHDVDDVTVSR
jgi:coenzyme F420-0:L-glutamate ligase/coenzyme F420-1:gamma-L-glutamate ligase